MKLARVTLTGADDNTDPTVLDHISGRFPFVEWGILFSFRRIGTERYPSLEWLDNFITYHTSIQRSLHLCGKSVINYIEGNELVTALASKFDRVQLNFNLKDMDADFHLRVLDRITESNPLVDPVFITQHHEHNTALYEHRDQKRQDHQFLFDVSGGNGIRGQWQKPLLGTSMCGYAGGLGPETLTFDLRNIAQIVGDQTIWIDMETNIRTEGKLDIVKCIKVLEIASRYVK